MCEGGRMPEKKHYRYFVYGVMGLCVYVIGVVAYAWWSNDERMNTLRLEIDKRMLVVAQSLKYMLAPDFHDRAVDEKSITFAEELRNRKALSDFALQTEFKWIYTLVEKDGKYYFSAPTVSEEEARERRSWYFYPYEDIPNEFVEAFRSGRAVYVDYSDQWGSFRSVAVPETSPGGRRYLSCADFEVTHFAALMRKNIIESVLTALFFFLCSWPPTLVAWRYFRASTVDLQAMNEELTRHKDHLEDLVNARTLELSSANNRLTDELHERKKVEGALQREKEKLESALTQVKTLSGLLPICSSCKKVRDDKGYWNQIERYIQDHSEAEFSHSICPECLKRLYPDLDVS